MKNLFIDASVFLSFYELGGEYLEKLEIIPALVAKSKIELLLTRQVLDEFKRRREGVLKRIVKGVENGAQIVEGLEDKISFAPIGSDICCQYPETKKIEKILAEADSYRKNLLTKLKKDIEKDSLQADKVIRKVFDGSKVIEMSNATFASAKKREALGNPPGKKNSLGDAVSWECLLDKAPTGGLIIISRDRDYCSVLKTEKANGFLSEEWASKKGGTLEYFFTIAEFLRSKFPDAKITQAEIQDERQAGEGYNNVSSIAEEYNKQIASIGDAYELFVSRAYPFRRIGSEFGGISGTDVAANDYSARSKKFRPS